jgi:hypothetical protein
MIQSQSASQSRLSSKLPTVIRGASEASKKVAGFAWRAFFNPFAASALRAALLPVLACGEPEDGMSRSTERTPAFAR